MACYFIVFSCIFLLGSSMPLDSTYEEYDSGPYYSSAFASQSLSGSLEEDSLIVKREITVMKDNSTAKVTPEQTFLLADVIHKIESSLLKSALDIVAILNTSNGTDEDVAHNVTDTTPSVADHALRKREVEDNSTVMTTSEAPKPIYTRLTTRSMASTSDAPAHISVDRITVYVADPGYFPMIPAFEIDPRIHKKQVESDKEKQTSVTPTTEKNTDVTSTEMTSTSSTTAKIAKRSLNTTETPKPTSDNDASKKSPQDSTTPKMSSSTKESSSSTSTTPKPSSSQPPTTKSSSSSASSTTPKNPVEELKEKEEEVKEQVAEIEAEPIILSTRV